MKRKLLVCSLLLLPFLDQAQTTLSGTVRDQNGEALAGVTATDSLSGITSLTGTEGNFQLSLPANSNNALLKIALLGQETVRIHWKQGQPLNLGTITLKQSVTLLQEVGVSATRAGDKTPMAFTDMNEEEIARNNQGRDIPFLLEQLPNVVSTSDAGNAIGYTGMRIRGSDATRINVTINGIPLNDAESQGTFWVNTPDLASSLTSVQVQRGVGTSSNGAAAFGATVNLETKGAETRPYASVDLGAGSFGTFRRNIQAGTGLINNRWFVNTRLSKITSNGYVDRASSNLTSYYLSGGYKGEKHSVTAISFGGHERTYQAWYGLDSLTFHSNPTFNYAGAIYDSLGNISRYYDNEVDDYRQDHYQLHWNSGWTNRWSSHLGLHYTYGRGFYEQYKQQEFLAEYGLPAYVQGSDTAEYTDLVRRLWLDNHFYGLVGNLTYSGDKLELILGGGLNRYEGDHFGELIWMQLASGSFPEDRFYENASVKTDANVYLKAYYTLTPGWVLFGDLQFRRVAYSGEGTDEGQVEIGFEDGLNFFNPKAGVQYRLNTNNRLYASWAIGHREPARTDYLGAAPGQTPQPERLSDIELGWQHQGNDLRAQVNVFYMDYRNQLVLTGEINNVGSPIRANVGSSFRSGLELSASWNITRGLDWSPNLSLSLNRNRDYFITNPDNSLSALGNTQLAYSPSVVGGSILRYTYKWASLSLINKYVGEQYLSNEERPAHRLPAYFIQDARLVLSGPWLGMKNTEFTFFVNNLFNTRYASNGYVYGGAPYYYAQAGTNYLASVRLNF